MRKTFPLTVEGRAPARVVESIKNEVRKYLRRERKKPLPEGVDYCDFACRVGVDEASAKEVHVEEVKAAIDGVVVAGGSAVYVEVLAMAGYRQRRERGASEKI